MIATKMENAISKRESANVMMALLAKVAKVKYASMTAVRMENALMESANAITILKDLLVNQVRIFFNL